MVEVVFLFFFGFLSDSLFREKRCNILYSPKPNNRCQISIKWGLTNVTHGEKKGNAERGGWASQPVAAAFSDEVLESVKILPAFPLM